MQDRDQDHYDHDQHQPGGRNADRALARPEVGVGPIAGIAPLGRGTDPIIVVVVRAHATSL